jgi:predicted pore-forming effector associated with SMODS systems
VLGDLLDVPAHPCPIRRVAGVQAEVPGVLTDLGAELPVLDLEIGSLVRLGRQVLAARLGSVCSSSSSTVASTSSASASAVSMSGTASAVVSRSMATSSAMASPTSAATVVSNSSTSGPAIAANAALAGRRPSPDDIAAAARHITDDADYRKWHGIDLGSTTWPGNVLLCQRQSMAWSRRDHRAYASTILIAGTAWFLVGVIIALVQSAASSQTRSSSSSVDRTSLGAV